jgi:hypothetical protein
MPSGSDIDRPTAGSGEVFVRVLAASLDEMLG